MTLILFADVIYGLRSGVTYTCGRVKSDFIFDDTSISRNHAEIKVSPKGEGHCETLNGLATFASWPEYVLYLRLLETCI